MAYNTIFFGSSAHSVTILKQLLCLPEFTLSAVVTKKDKPIGRDQTITPNPVAQFAVDHHLPLLQPEEFTPDFKLKIKNIKIDIGLCVAYGPPFFDQEMIDLPTYKIVNIHPSPLPKYRGATPGPWQIINGETTSAVTFFQIDALPDHGPIISQIPFDISSTETSATFYSKAFKIAADQLGPILKSYIINPKSSLKPQDHSQKTYFPKFTKETALIDWSWDSQKINRFVRAMIPWPIAWTYVENQSGQKLSMKIFSYQTEPIEVQIEGKKPTLWSEIKNYYRIITVTKP